LNTKAKILINDLEIYYNIKKTANFRTSTIFADYRCLKILDHFNVISYNEIFKEKLETNGKIFNFSQTVNPFLE